MVSIEHALFKITVKKVGVNPFFDSDQLLPLETIVRKCNQHFLCPLCFQRYQRRIELFVPHFLKPAILLSGKHFYVHQDTTV